MPFTCGGAGSLWLDVAWRLALMAPILAPRDIVSHANVRMVGSEFRLINGSRGQRQGLQLSVSAVLAGWPNSQATESRKLPITTVALQRTIA
jgi:hypothetical protein